VIRYKLIECFLMVICTMIVIVLDSLDAS